MKFPLLSLLYLCLLPLFSSAQDEGLLNRLNAIQYRGIDFFNAEGIEVTVQKSKGKFNKKNIVKGRKRYVVKQQYLKLSDNLFRPSTYHMVKSRRFSDKLVQNVSFYFIEQPNEEIKGITFSAINKVDKRFESDFIDLLESNKITPAKYEDLLVDSINFAGRKMWLGSSYRWMGINHIGCPKMGTMSWSVYKHADSAAKGIVHNYELTKLFNKGIIVQEDKVPVTFEGVDVEARRLVYKFKGISAFFSGLDGGLTQTIYFLSVPLRGNSVSCSLSFFNTDNIDHETGLPPLLNKVMKLKK